MMVIVIESDTVWPDLYVIARDRPPEPEHGRGAGQMTGQKTA